jgi:hypothetical protein
MIKYTTMFFYTNSNKDIYMLSFLIKLYDEMILLFYDYYLFFFMK